MLLFAIPGVLFFLFGTLMAESAHRKRHEFVYGLSVFFCGMMFMLVVIAIASPVILEIFSASQ